MEKETTDIIGKAGKIAADSGLLGWLGTATAAGFTFLVGKVWRGLGHRIKNAEQAATNAAALARTVDDRRREDTTALHERIEKHADRDEEIHRETMNVLREQTGMLGKIDTHLERELGARPTRTEVVELIKLHQAAR